MRYQTTPSLMVNITQQIALVTNYGDWHELQTPLGAEQLWQQVPHTQPLHF
jgi:hypothetical protein